ncbi:hypothetical protein BDU57DRAFT_515424 [Ampelomyces quisqualis]|uniref:Uncharacterized protein n=1 Tax=Ampelomyces quisqualis TaxID=50730 RepID=A0A6A5QS14_AMPQU|nr:hypothetical protein BDU57DRAFT_515424 [Ampelomyces quisqualis]
MTVAVLDRTGHHFSLSGRELVSYSSSRYLEHFPLPPLSLNKREPRFRLLTTPSCQGSTSVASTTPVMLPTSGMMAFLGDGFARPCLYRTCR